jgi:lysophospholipase L1-like esterase
MNASNKSFTQLAGFALIIAGVIANEWLLAQIFSPDGRLLSATRIIILLIDVLLISSGIFLLIVKSFLKLFLIYASLLFSLFLVEKGLLRYFDLSEEFFIENPIGTGSYRLKPDLKIQRRIGAASFDFHTNSRGMPWREVNVENSQNKLRIAFVGDSFVFGCCASRPENSFVSTFDRKLDSKYEVLNFGVVGYGLADEKLLIQEEVLQFKPKYIVLAFYNGNDFSDTFLSISPNGKLLGVHGRSPGDRADIATNFTTTQKRTRAITNTATFRLLNQLLMTREDPRNIFGDANRFDSWVFWSRRNYPPVAQKARELSLHVLNDIVNSCSRNQIQIVVVTIPYVNQVYAPEMITTEFDFHLPQMYLEDFLKGRDTLYFDLLPPLRDYFQRTGHEIYLRGDGHFNDEGHQLVGNLLLDYLKLK